VTRVYDWLIGGATQAALHYTTAGSIIPILDSIKVLGVILDSNLTLKQHTLALCHNIHYHSHALRHIRLVLSIPMASSVAAAIVQSGLDYASSLLNGTSTTNTHKLQCTQNTLSRIVLSNSPYRHLSADLRFAHLHWLLVDMHIKFKIAKLTSKFFLLASLHTFITFSSHTYRYVASAQPTNNCCTFLPSEPTSASGLSDMLPYSVERYSTYHPGIRHIKYFQKTPQVSPFQ